MQPALYFAVAGLAACAGAVSAKEPSVSFQMISDGPPELERAVRPYRDCATRFFKANSGKPYEAVIATFDFRLGPPECRDARESSSAAGFSTLSSELDENRRRELVRQELLTVDLSIFSGLIWTAQDAPETQ